MKLNVPLLALALLLCAGMVAAQENCPEIVQTALQAANQFCSSTERNQACYGNVALTAESQPGVNAFNFDSPGDITEVASISRLHLEPMNTAAGTWGLVIMQLQADLPDTMPGQNVTVILFGDVEIQNAATGGQNPMQAFYLKTGVGDAPCAEAPESGMMVQTPQGIGQVAFNVNGVDVQMGSTVTFQANPGENMVIRTLEGSASIEIDDVEYPILQGTQFEAAIDENFIIDAAQVYIDFYTAEMIDDLPLDMLQRVIDPVELTQEEFDLLYELMGTDAALCSDDPGAFLPSCDDVNPLFGGEACVYQPSPDAPLCAEANPCAYLPADVAAACEENLQEAIASGEFDTGEFFDFSDPCAIVPAEFAGDCAAAVQDAIETGELPDSLLDFNIDTDDYNIPGIEDFGNTEDNGIDGDTGTDDSGVDDDGGDDGGEGDDGSGGDDGGGGEEGGGGDEGGGGEGDDGSGGDDGGGGDEGGGGEG